MSKYIYITTVAADMKEFSVQKTYADLCKVYTNREKAKKSAQNRSKDSSYFKTCAVYCADIEILPIIGYDYLTLIAAYEDGNEIDVFKDAL